MPKTISEPSHKTLANAIRVLAMDAVQAANSGHPGMPMGMSDIAEVLWREFLQHNPKDPNWLDRDRFILSNGHGSMLHYALLHLSGYDLSIDDLKNFRKLHSKTAGHPELGITPGVECTTGPLGQGLANGVGMAIAEKHLAAEFNQDKFKLVDHFTYVFAGDGCLMEGISHEACSLAGTLELGKLIVFWDNNHISIDGDTAGWFTENVPERFKAYHWQVIDNIDGHDHDAIKQAIIDAHKNSDQPTIICCETTIGHGAPNKAGKASAHGEPLGEAEILAAKANYDWHSAAFEISDDIYQAWDATQIGHDMQNNWNELFAQYETEHPKLARELLRRTHGDLPETFSKHIDGLIQEGLQSDKALATRKSSKHFLDMTMPFMPEMMGGSADLSGSNCTLWKDASVFTKDKPAGQYINYGVREFAMSAIMNGITLHKGLRAYGGTFLVFSDYARNAIRMAALMQQPTIFVYTHDSIGLGEDGPTHQPIEHTSSLRLIPNLNVWRPCDDLETYIAWQDALEQKQTPSALLFTRQNLMQQKHSAEDVDKIKKGGYVLLETGSDIQFVIMATGSEVELAVSAANKLAEDAIYGRVVSMPCCDIFKLQTNDYKTAVLGGENLIKVSIEAGSPDYWYQFVGLSGTVHSNVVGINRFGESAPANDVYAELGLTVDNLITTIKKLGETTCQ